MSGPNLIDPATVPTTAIGGHEVKLPPTPFDLPDCLLLLARRGSESHGLFVPSTDPNSIDDRDLLGVVVPPRRHYLGLRQGYPGPGGVTRSAWEHGEAIVGEWDTVLYELRKFVGLLLRSNPNVLGMLWLEPEDYLLLTPAAKRLVAARDLFKGRHAAYESFTGYAEAQLRKMTHATTEGYMGAKRKRLVEEHGFDRKNAAHLVRLLHMGTEYLRTGEMKVRRTWDRDMLLAIKTGGRDGAGETWPLDRVQRYADSCFRAAKAAYERSPLPEYPQYEAVEDLLLEILSERLSLWNAPVA